MIATNSNNSPFSYRTIILAISLTISSHTYGNDDTDRLTEYGYPDLQGIWGQLTFTPFERPRDLGTKQFYTEEEAQEEIQNAIDFDLKRKTPSDPNRGAPPVGSRITNQADFNFAPELPHDIATVDGEYRTSLIVRPENGRIPYRDSVSDFYDKFRKAGKGDFDGPEIRPVAERCLALGAQIPHMVPSGRYTQIVQTKDHVMIFTENDGKPRIIRLNSEHRDTHGGKWLGDSIGHYEGDTLVVHTQGFRPEQSNRFIKSSENLEVTERFRLENDDKLIYTYTASDELVFEDSFTAQIPMSRIDKDSRLFEYACHEGNYSLSGVLAGARRLEIEQRDSKSSEY